MIEKDHRRASLRSFAWTLLLIPFLFLPYRWAFIPCGLAGVVLVWPRKASLKEIFRSDGTLIVGSLIVLLVRTLFDPSWWLPWLIVMVGLFALRRSGWWFNRIGIVAMPIAAVLAVVLLYRPTLPGADGDARSAAPKTESVLVCAGDSLTAGIRPGTDEGTYVARFRETLNCCVVNAGVASDRAADLLRRLDKTVLAHNPDVVLVFIGGNDYLDGTPRATFASHLEQVVSRIAAYGAEVVLVEVPSGIVWNPYAGVYRRIAARHDAMLVPETRLRWWYTMELLFRSHLKDPLTSDGIHLTESGAAKVADWLRPHVVEALRNSVQP